MWRNLRVLKQAHTIPFIWRQIPRSSLVLPFNFRYFHAHIADAAFLPRGKKELMDFEENSEKH